MLFAILEGHFRELALENTRQKLREVTLLRDLKSAQALMYEYADLFYNADNKRKDAETEAINLRRDCDCWWNPNEVRRRSGH